MDFWAKIFCCWNPYLIPTRFHLDQMTKPIAWLHSRHTQGALFNWKKVHDGDDDMQPIKILSALLEVKTGCELWGSQVSFGELNT